MAGYCRWTMAKRTSNGAAPEFSSLALSLHHRRQDDERPGVYRHSHQDQYYEHQSDGDEYPAQRAGGGRVVDLTLWRNVANTDNGQQRSGRSVELRVSAQLENLAILRTLVAAVGTFEDLDFDAVADLRLAVDEACTRLIRSAVPDSTLLLVVEPREDAVVINASTTCKSPDILAPGSFSWHVLSSLTDEVRTFQNGLGPEEGQVFGISMTARRASSLR
jgi:anti-sigma regulatory factor (Ser/Thr protein kinase)